MFFRKEDDVELKIVVNYSKDEKKVILPNEVRKFILLAFKDGLSLENPAMVYSEIWLFNFRTKVPVWNKMENPLWALSTISQFVSIKYKN